jgi:hypothetical protein
MKTANEIQAHIHNLETELTGVKEWANKAYDRYREDKKEWGDADYGEVSTAYEAVNELENQITALKWVLGE